MPRLTANMHGGSGIHSRGRKRLNKALGMGKPILCRADDCVAIRAATFDEVLKSYKSPDGVIWIPTEMDCVGHYGVRCVVKMP